MKSITLVLLTLIILVGCKKEEIKDESMPIQTLLTTYGGGATDIDNNSYTTVIIGNQEWMAENLKTTRFSNSDPISNLETSNDWIQTTSPAWCFYDNDASNNSGFGKLYNWYAANDSRNICPAGWRLPSTNDYLELINYIDNGGSLSSNDAGSHLKTKGNQNNNSGLWISSNSNATNAYSFSGKRNYQFGANFFTKFYSVSFWTSTESSSQNAFHMSLYNDSQVIDNVETDKGMGVCIRCIKN